MSCCFRKVDSFSGLPVSASTSTYCATNKSAIALKKYICNQTNSTKILDAILSDPRQLEALKTFCKKRYCEEQFLFIQAFNSWKNNPTEKGVHELLRVYIQPNAEYAINVSETCYDRISQLLIYYDQSAEEIFDEIQNCYNTTVTDLWANYRCE